MGFLYELKTIIHNSNDEYAPRMESGRFERKFWKDAFQSHSQIRFFILCIQISNNFSQMHKAITRQFIEIEIGQCLLGHLGPVL